MVRTKKISYKEVYYAYTSKYDDNAINDKKILEKVSRYSLTKEKFEKEFQLISIVEVAKPYFPVMISNMLITLS